MPNFLRDLIKKSETENSYIAEDELSASEFTGYVDTGCYILNAMFSGSLYGGLPNNKVTAFAGETSVGKSFISLSIVKSFLDSDPNAFVVYYDTEASITRSMMADRGIDVARVIIAEPETLEKFKTHAIKMIDAYEETDKEDRPAMLMVLDSLSMLPSNKEVDDVQSGSDKRDMTKSGVIRGAFRVLTLRCAKAKVPLIVNSHVYASIGAYIPSNEIAGGGGLKYAASTIIELRKKRNKDEKTKEVVGNFIIAKQIKGRLTKPDTQVEMSLSFKTGLDRYHGLLQLAEKHGIFKKEKQGYSLDGVKISTKEIEANLKEYLTPDVMERLEVAAHKEYEYGNEESEEEGIEEADGGQAST